MDYEDRKYIDETVRKHEKFLDRSLDRLSAGGFEAHERSELLSALKKQT